MSQPRARNVAPAKLSPLGEGWFILILGALSSGLLGAVVGAYTADANPSTMATLASAGYLAGYTLARTYAPDALAHLITFVLGIVIALAAIEPRTLYHQLRAGEWQVIGDRYESLLRGFIRSIDSGDNFETDIAVFAIGLTMWLVGYTAAWMLFRRGWVFWSVALPGGILLVTLALEREQASWPALLYLGFALAIAAGQTAISRTTFWSARGIEQPRSFGRRSIVLGTLIAALAVGIGLYYSFDLDDRFKERAMSSGDRVASWVEDRFESSSSNPPAPQDVAGNYGAFADQFKVGDGVPSGDTPIVVVQANGEEYLAARRLNEYDGAGWRSTSSQAGDPTSQAPRMAFRSDQPMNIPRDQQQYRAQDDATITLLQPTDQLLFTIDQHYSASVPTLVRVGWQPVDATYTVGQTELSEVPVDLRDLVGLLQSSDFVPPGTSATPELESPQASAQQQKLQDRLLTNYPVTSELSWADDGSVQVHFTGRLPVYSDIEAVYGSAELDNATYSVVGLVPQMTAADLEAAGGNYPAYVTDTYLQLPGTVTQETRDLANQIVQQAGAVTPYDQAVAIQNYLRTNFTYQIDAGGAPDGRDIVDYFLFDSQVGRCDHYASSMAVMLRMLGVPTRIVTGLAPVSYDSEMSGYVYRGRNAHAWAEVYFPGFGWVPFEPTPTQTAIDLDLPGNGLAATPEPTPSPDATTESDQTSMVATPSPTATATPMPVPATTDIQGTSAGSNGPSGVFFGLGAAAIALAAIGGFVFWRRRNAFAGLPPARANYGRLQRLGRFLGIEPAPELTPREYAVRFGAAKPKSAGGAIRVADAFTQEQYASNVDAGSIAQNSDYGWREAKQGASDWRLWRRR
ncbi:MAG TPA: transglutaminase-like domain-containing protein [Thermomicrobiales bacterium]|nr:transglutaminase-like domain-containing protein [Thermomicrobiales bacterium]